MKPDIYIVNSGNYNLNTYIVKFKDVSILIDPSCNIASIEEIINQSLYVPYIFLTHGHFDHLESAHYFQNKYNGIIYLHKRDKRLMYQSNLYARIARYGKSISIPNEVSFFDSSDMYIEKFNINVIHTPGHSKGSSSIIIDNNIFVGDTFVNGKIGVSDFPEFDLETLINSIKILITKYKYYWIYQGHGKSFQLTDEKIEQIIGEINGNQN